MEQVADQITLNVESRVENILLRGNNNPVRICDFLSKLEHLLDDFERENHLHDMINVPSKTIIAENWIVRYPPYGGEPLNNYYQRYSNLLPVALHPAKFYTLVSYVTGMHRENNAYNEAVYVN